MEPRVISPEVTEVGALLRAFLKDNCYLCLCADQPCPLMQKKALSRKKKVQMESAASGPQSSWNQLPVTSEEQRRYGTEHQRCLQQVGKMWDLV